MQPKSTQGYWLMALATAFLGGAALAPVAQAQNPTPFINQISPVADQVGGSSFTLTVSGAGFASSAVVNWRVGATTLGLGKDGRETHVSLETPLGKEKS